MEIIERLRLGLGERRSGRRSSGRWWWGPGRDVVGVEVGMMKWLSFHSNKTSLTAAFCL